MGIMKEIRRYKTRKKVTKREILLRHEKEIRAMIDEGVPLTRQIDLIIQNGILEKIDYKQYRKILVDWFDYKGTPTRPTSRTFEIKEKKREDRKPKTINPKKPKTEKRRRDPVRALEEDADLLDFY